MLSNELYVNNNKKLSDSMILKQIFNEQSSLSIEEEVKVEVAEKIENQELSSNFKSILNMFSERANTNKANNNQQNDQNRKNPIKLYDVEKEISHKKEISIFENIIRNNNSDKYNDNQDNINEYANNINLKLLKRGSFSNHYTHNFFNRQDHIIHVEDENKYKKEIEVFNKTTQLISKNKENVESISSLVDCFFIVSVCKDRSTFLNMSESDYDNNTCSHSYCNKLPPISPEIIYKNQVVNEKELEINSFLGSLFFPSGINLCYSDDEKDLLKPKSLSTTFTNQEGTIYYMQSLIYYNQISKGNFDTSYPRMNLKNEILQIDKLIEKMKNEKTSKLIEKKFQERLELWEIVNYKDYVYIPTAFVLISKQPFLLEMKEILKSIVISSSSSIEEINMKINDDLLIIQKSLPSQPKLDNKPLSLKFFMSNIEYPIVLNYPSIKDLPLSPTNYLPIFLLEYFTIEKIIYIFYLIKLEKKLIFFANDEDILSKVIHSFISIIYPLEWTYTIIPILTLETIKFIQNFMPFIMGIKSIYINHIKDYYEDCENLILININKGIIFNFDNQVKSKDLKKINQTSKSIDIKFPDTTKNKLLQRLVLIEIDYNYFKTIIFTDEKINESLKISLDDQKSYFDISQKDEYYNTIKKSIDISSDMEAVDFSQIQQLFQEKNLNIEDMIDQYKLYSLTDNLKLLIIFLELRNQLYNLNKAFRQVFLLSHEEEFGDYEKYLSIIDEIPLFNNETFIKLKPSKESEYYEEILSTQNFLLFLQNNQHSEEIFKNKTASGYSHIKHPKVMLLKYDEDDFQQEIKLKSIFNQNYNSGFFTKFNSIANNNSSLYQDIMQYKMKLNEDEGVILQLIKEFLIFQSNYFLLGKYKEYEKRRYRKTESFNQQYNDIDIDKEKENDNKLLDVFFVPPSQSSNENFFFFLSNKDYSQFKTTVVSHIKENQSRPKLNEYVINKILLPKIDNNKQSKYKKYIYPLPYGLNKNLIVKSRLKRLKISIRLKNRNTIQNERPIKETITDYFTKIFISNPLTNEEKSNLYEILKLDKGKWLFSYYLYQQKFENKKFHCLDNTSFNSLKAFCSFIILNTSNIKENFEVIRLITKSLFYYYKINSKNQNTFLGQVFNKSTNLIKIWNEDVFWSYYFSQEMKNEKIKNQETIFGILHKMILMMNDLIIPGEEIYKLLIIKIAVSYLSNNELIDKLNHTIWKGEVSKN